MRFFSLCRERSGGGMRILVVDDEVNLLSVVRHGLAKAGYAVRTAADGASASAALGREAAEVWISDGEMPGMTGPELCRAVRAARRGGETYLILLTGKAGAACQADGLCAGADAYLTKPFEMDD